MSLYVIMFFFFFKQKTAYEVRISDWSSDVCSSDLEIERHIHQKQHLSVFLCLFVIPGEAQRRPGIPFLRHPNGIPARAAPNKCRLAGMTPQVSVGDSLRCARDDGWV